MDDRLTDRIFSELDAHAKRLVDLSKIVHANAATLGIVTKLIISIIIFIVITGIGIMYEQLKPIVSIGVNSTTYGITTDLPDDQDKGGD